MKILVTAGPTREPLDPVRFLSNRSTGKMGIAVAQAAKDLGHDVNLIVGPVQIPLPKNITTIAVTTAAEMLEAVHREFETCDALIMTAAVSDWTPVHVQARKQKKTFAPSILALKPTVDILLSLKDRKKDRVVVGFAAETDHVVEEAKRKLIHKGVDLIVANNVLQSQAGFEVDTNEVVFVMKDGVQALPCMSKYKVAKHIIEWITNRLNS